MPIYKYTVKNKDGKTVSGKINVPSKEAVLDLLRRQEFVPISIQETKPGISPITLPITPVSLVLCPVSSSIIIQPEIGLTYTYINYCGDNKSP